ncbi:hypothetical protein GCM10022268_30950 [Sphingomonas cynarae]|uniref:Uncharacterized protein n=2 Tax=Sphingomonas cynarae TaxID=930197 RepID=A0ABP7EKI6_9SPHN
MALEELRGPIKRLSRCLQHGNVGRKDVNHALPYMSLHLTPGLICQRFETDRLGQPDDIADAIEQLVSGKAHWISGQSVRAHGGMA